MNDLCCGDGRYEEEILSLEELEGVQPTRGSRSGGGEGMGHFPAPCSLGSLMQTSSFTFQTEMGKI